jgi:hypothetical protein
MPEDLTIWLTLLASFAVGCLGFVLMGAVFLGVFFFFIKAFTGVSSKASRELSQPAEKYFAEITPQLLPWTSEALADLSAYLAYSRRGRRGKLHARGVVKSLSQPDSAGRLAFDLQIQRAKGTMLQWEGAMILKSDSRAWRLRFLGLTHKETPVEIDGTPLGTIQDRGKEILLLDPDSQPVGCYRQYQLVGGIGGLTKYAQTPCFGPLELHQRHIADLNRNPLLLRPLIGGEPAPPLVTNLASDLRADEAQWLVALVGWEILYRIVTA